VFNLVTLTTLRLLWETFIQIWASRIDLLLESRRGSGSSIVLEKDLHFFVSFEAASSSSPSSSSSSSSVSFNPFSLHVPWLEYYFIDLPLVRSILGNLRIVFHLTQGQYCRIVSLNSVNYREMTFILLLITLITTAHFLVSV